MQRFYLLGLILSSLLLTSCSLKEEKKELSKVTVHYVCIHTSGVYEFKLRFHKTTSSFRERELLNEILEEQGLPKYYENNKDGLHCFIKTKCPS